MEECWEGLGDWTDYVGLFDYLQDLQLCIQTQAMASACPSETQV